MEIYLPLLISLIGLVLYAVCTDPKLPTIGLGMFKAGLLAFLLLYGLHPVKL
jgi:hypothetical protein